MANYSLALQKTRAGKACVCIVSAVNGKLVLKGEPINRRIDALKVAHGIGDAMGLEPVVLDVYPWNYPWPKNAGNKAITKTARKK